MLIDLVLEGEWKQQAGRWVDGWVEPDEQWQWGERELQAQAVSVPEMEIASVVVVS